MKLKLFEVHMYVIRDQIPSVFHFKWDPQVDKILKSPLFDGIFLMHEKLGLNANKTELLRLGCDQRQRVGALPKKGRAGGDYWSWIFFISLIF